MERSVLTNCTRVFFILLNCIFVLFAAAIVALGSYLLYLGEENDYSVITGSNIVSGAALLLVAGVITLTVTAVGIVGACGMWRPLLFIYIVSVVVMVAMFIAAGVLGFVFRDEVTDELDERMTDAVKDYRTDESDEGYNEDVNDVVAYFQETFECCGVNSSVDWFTFNPNVTHEGGNKPPRECLCDIGEDDDCVNFNFTYSPPESLVEQRADYNAWDRGCLDRVEDNLTAIAISVGVLGIIVAMIGLIGILFSICLMVCITKDKSGTFV